VRQRDFFEEYGYTGEEMPPPYRILQLYNQTMALYRGGSRLLKKEGVVSHTPSHTL